MDLTQEVLWRNLVELRRDLVKLQIELLEMRLDTNQQKDEAPYRADVQSLQSNRQELSRLNASLVPNFR